MVTTRPRSSHPLILPVLRTDPIRAHDPEGPVVRWSRRPRRITTRRVTSRRSESLHPGPRHGCFAPGKTPPVFVLFVEFQLLAEFLETDRAPSPHCASPRKRRFVDKLNSFFSLCISVRIVFGQTFIHSMKTTTPPASRHWIIQYNWKGYLSNGRHRYPPLPLYTKPHTPSA